MDNHPRIAGVIGRFEGAEYFYKWRRQWGHVVKIQLIKIDPEFQPIMFSF